MKVWVVYADNHDYDVMSQWLVGVFTSQERAEQEAVMEQGRYRDRRTNPSTDDYCNTTITETTLDAVCVPQ
jgi:hypothetical protein